MCCGHSRMMLHIFQRNPSGTSLWNVSETEFTKMRRGFRQCRGWSSRDSWHCTDRNGSE